MRFAYLTVMMLALVITVTARVLTAKRVSHLKALERLISGEYEKNIQHGPIVRDFLENHVAKRKYSTVPLRAFLQRKIEINICDKLRTFVFNCI